MIHDVIFIISLSSAMIAINTVFLLPLQF